MVNMMDQQNRPKPYYTRNKMGFFLHLVSSFHFCLATHFQPAPFIIAKCRKPELLLIKNSDQLFTTYLMENL